MLKKKKGIKLIIAGGRNLKPSFGFINSAVLMLKPYDHGHISQVVCGGAQGVDNEGAHWASHAEVDVKYFRANWKKWGKAAGPKRNRQMAEYGDVLLLIWNGQSKGSASMKAEMERLNKPIYEIILKKPYKQ